jgi:hypothetical protein
MWFLLFPGDTVHRALPGTGTTPGAPLGIDSVGKQALTLVSRTLLFIDMGLALITKIAKGCQNRVRSALPQPT